jgi:hypothetical protein
LTKGARESDTQFRCFGTEGPGERRPQVCVVALEQHEPVGLSLTRQLGISALSEGDEVRGVATAQVGSRIQLVQPLDSVFPDCLEHREALAGVPEKALVNQRL